MFKYFRAVFPITNTGTIPVDHLDSDGKLVETIEDKEIKKIHVFLDNQYLQWIHEYYFTGDDLYLFIKIEDSEKGKALFNTVCEMTTGCYQMDPDEKLKYKGNATLKELFAQKYATHIT